jgi:hypothetical protein
MCGCGREAGPRCFAALHRVATRQRWAETDRVRPHDEVSRAHDPVASAQDKSLDTSSSGLATAPSGAPSGALSGPLPSVLATAEERT